MLSWLQWTRRRWLEMVSGQNSQDSSKVLGVQSGEFVEATFSHPQAF